jgi:thioredoxin 1
VNLVSAGGFRGITASAAPNQVESPTTRQKGSSTASNNVLLTKKRPQPKDEGTKTLPVTEARRQLELEVQTLLRKEKEKESKWIRKGDIPKNIVFVESKEHLKTLVMQNVHAAVVVDFFSAECHACKSMWPKIKQVAEQNDSVLFAKINTSEPDMAEIADGLNVSKLPWFLIFQGEGDMVASFTANLKTFDVLRTEVSLAKERAEESC